MITLNLNNQTYERDPDGTWWTVGSEGTRFPMSREWVAALDLDELARLDAIGEKVAAAMKRAQEQDQAKDVDQ